jgi:hypothetical protein
MDIIHQQPLTIGQKRFTRRSALGGAITILARAIADNIPLANHEQLAQATFDDLLALEIEIATASGGYRGSAAHQKPSTAPAAFPQKGSA